MKSLQAAVLLLVCHSTSVFAEVKLDSLKVGLNEFKSVTVTLDSENRAKIIHDAGIARVPLSDLPVEVQKSLKSKDPDKGAALSDVQIRDEHPMESKAVPNAHFSDGWVKAEFNKLIDSKPNGKIFALTIQITDNPKQRQFIKIIFDKTQGKLFHLKRSIPSLGTQAHYTLVTWNNINREILRDGIPWMDDNFNPLGKSEQGASPINLRWTCELRPEIAEWP